MVYGGPPVPGTNCPHHSPEELELMYQNIRQSPSRKVIPYASTLITTPTLAIHPLLSWPYFFQDSQKFCWATVCFKSVIVEAILGHSELGKCQWFPTPSEPLFKDVRLQQPVFDKVLGRFIDIVTIGTPGIKPTRAQIFGHGPGGQVEVIVPQTKLVI